jgi:uncharacterized protein (DUF952 family)
MYFIYHIVARSSWEQTGAEPYRADSLATEGFIHCSYRDQVAKVANWFYRDQADLLVLHIDTDRLTSPLRAEDPGIGEAFPHVYGPIDRPAVVAVEPLQRGADGQWIFPGNA